MRRNKCINVFKKYLYQSHCLAPNEALEQWLRLQTHMECFPPPLHTYQRCFTTFICRGWGYGCIIMPFPPHMLVKIWKVRSNPEVTTWRQMKYLRSGWGSKPTWNGSHIHSRQHMKGDWQSSYAVDGDMDASSCRSHHKNSGTDLSAMHISKLRWKASRKDWMLIAALEENLWIRVVGFRWNAGCPGMHRNDWRGPIGK